LPYPIKVFPKTAGGRVDVFLYRFEKNIQLLLGALIYTYAVQMHISRVQFIARGVEIHNSYAAIRVQYAFGSPKVFFPILH
jgi:hypothetical protein